MQIKKMKDTGDQLCAAQVSGGPRSLTMAPKQPGSHRATRPDRQEVHTVLYQGAEAEATTVNFATCVQCKVVHKIPPRDPKKGPGQSQAEDNYVCFKCSLYAAPTQLHFMNNSDAAHGGNDIESIFSPASSKFKVRNFKPGKYYCDKCRFSTKDLLQYKKHTLQHEEIKFICSHCSYVSYTKGEFQRHLVKHTGVFPYRCEYCDYGAIRNDYIVKHRRRVHERAGAKQPLKTVTKLEPKRSNVSRQSVELLKTPSPRTVFQNKLSDQLSRFSLHASKDTTHGVMLLPESKEHQKDVVCVPNKAALSEPSGASLLGNKSVEVEVLSPAKEPVQPGVPLTVVAPAELVVPTNCLAQLIDVKVVNGTQQLVLKLFPLEENPGLEAGKADGGRSEQTEKSSREQSKVLSAQAAKPLTIEGNVGGLVDLDRLHASVQRQLRSVKWVKSCDFFMSGSGGGRNPRDSFLNPDRAKDAQKEQGAYPHRAALSSGALKGQLPASVASSSVSCGPGEARPPLLWKDAVSFAVDGGRSLHRNAQRLLPSTASLGTISCSADNRLLPGSKDDLDSRGKMCLPDKTGSPDRNLEGDEVKDHEAVSMSGQTPPARAKECLHGSPAGEDRPGHLLSQPGSSERTNGAFDGPVISSVFSLSSGSENVPDAIRWNNPTTKIKSIELLRRKIAQLMESCGKPPSTLSANSTQRRSGAQAPKPTSTVALEGIQEISMSLPGPSAAPLQKPTEDVPDGGQTQQQLCPQFANGGDRRAEGPVTRKTHVATPVLIPKGAVLRVLNSSEDAGIIEATCDSPVGIPCGETHVPGPGAFSVKRAGSGLQPGTRECGSADLSPSLETALWPKSRREDAVCSALPKQAGVLPSGQAGSSDGSKQGRLVSRSLATNRSKAKQVSSAKKKSKTLPDPGRPLKSPSIFQVARQLRLIAVKPDQLIKCPRRNQPVIVLNHPDVDSPEVTNVMKVINKYKGNVLKVVLSERTRCQLGIRRHHVRLTYQNSEEADQIKRQMMLKMKLKKVHKNNYQVVDSLPDDTSQCIFKCWFCGRLYEDQEEWMSHGQRHLIEATRDWDVLSSKGK